LLRCGVAKHGFRPLLLGLLSLGVLALPLAPMILGLYWLVAIVGTAGILYASRLVRRGRETVRSLVRRYAALTSHSDQLGMQALVGRGLRALVTGWIPYRTFRTASVGVGFSLIIWFSLLWAGTLAHVGPFHGTLIGHLCQAVLQGLDGDGVHICSALPVGNSKWFQWVALFAWFILSVSCFLALLGSYGAADRVLLVVDDLDRCAPQEIVDLIESLKLPLEDEEVQDRVQVLMLVDEDVLAHAITVKFDGLIKERARNLDQDEARVAVISRTYR
jgi:hypothetical protein